VGAEPSRGDTCEEETKEGARGEEGAHEEEFEEGLWGRGGGGRTIVLLRDGSHDRGSLFLPI
jgi:hypothetical protein